MNPKRINQLKKQIEKASKHPKNSRLQLEARWAKEDLTKANIKY